MKLKTILFESIDDLNNNLRKFLTKIYFLNNLNALRVTFTD